MHPNPEISDSLLDGFAQSVSNRHPWPYVREMARQLRSIRDILRETAKYHRDTCSSQLCAGYACDCGKDQADRLLGGIKKKCTGISA